MSELVPIVVSTLFGSVAGAAGGAWGVTMALRAKVESQGERIFTVETKVGVNKDGVLTGNGLLGRMTTVEGRVNRLAVHRPTPTNPNEEPS